MKHFPIFAQGICLGVALVFKADGVWRLQYLRDDRHGPIFTLAEISSYISKNDTEFASMIARLGYVIRDIEEYTGCPIVQPRAVQKCGLHVKAESVRNPLLTLVQVEDSPWMADFMLPWYSRGQIVFENVRSDSTMIFTLDNGVLPEPLPVVTVSGDSSLIYCSFIGMNSALSNVQAAFCKFNSVELRNQSMHNGYVYGKGDEARVCA